MPAISDHFSIYADHPRLFYIFFTGATMDCSIGILKKNSGLQYWYPEKCSGSQESTLHEEDHVVYFDISFQEMAVLSQDSFEKAAVSDAAGCSRLKKPAMANRRLTPSRG